ncbi:putative papain-like cysteine peptidase superfamily [Helianthus annuus]|nr:putative papain-like cysteine peptidase superfamily [Helianthus annuus]KAJ0819809.1 putative papain-like cysteine peptidase superfamily [Helianthus annuus]
MYLNCDDFEAVFTFTKLIGAVLISYIMFLYEQIKKEQIHDHGICFMNQPTISRADQRKTKSNTSRMQVERLQIDCIKERAMTSSYYPTISGLIFLLNKAMVVYASQSGVNIRVKLIWINARCSRQSGGTECGYYVMKFMKEITYKGVEILDNDNVGKEVF